MVALDSVILKLWGLEAEGWAASEDLKRSIAHLSSQEPRSKTDEAACHQAVIEELKLCDPLAEGVEGIEYVNEAEVCLEEFNQKFIAHSKPCMIRGACEGWKAVKKWACVQDLVRTHGNIPIRITECKDHPSAMAKPLRVPLRNFCSYVEGDSGGAEFPWYGFEDDFGGERQALLEDYEVPR